MNFFTTDRSAQRKFVFRSVNTSALLGLLLMLLTPLLFYGAFYFSFFGN